MFRLYRTIPEQRYAFTQLIQSAGEITVMPRAGKKPIILLNGIPLTVDHSISHSGGVYIIAVATSPSLKIGIDVEQVRPVRKNAGSFFLTQHEMDSLIGDYSLFQLWTIKEAVLKALGIGLAGYLKGIRIKRILNNRAEIDISRANITRADIIAVHRITCYTSLVNDYAFALAKLESATQIL